MNPLDAIKQAITEQMDEIRRQSKMFTARADELEREGK